MDKIDGMSIDITNANIEKIKELFPNAVTEGKIDFDMLRTILGDEVDTSKEKYQFTWNGKAESIKIAQAPSAATLRPCKEKSKNWDTTNNLYIEGDNLEVLKQLQKTYYGKIKMIFIDPPYNTGNDFVYKDDYKNSIENYKEQTNQTQKSNPETSGRYHSDWLSMMYPRLILARNLLSEDGAIFISIDDHEQAALKLICDEVFGIQNFVTDLIWQHSVQSNGYGGKFVNQYNHILVYAKSNQFKVGLLPRTDEDNKLYKNPDNDPRGPWRSGYCVNGLYRPNLKYEITTPSGKTISPPEKGWRWSKETLHEKIKEQEIVFNEDETSIIHKLFLKDLEGKVPENIWAGGIAGTTRQAMAELKELFHGKAPFDTPKPVELIIRILSLSTEEDSMVMDFFSGSATTAHATMKLNMEDGGRRKYIMVQLPEITGDSEFSSLCNVGEERIRKAGETIKEEWQQQEEEKGMLEEETFPVDVGFKVFKLDSTNINPWDNTKELDEQTVFDTATVFKTDRTKEDVLYEIMLKYGVFDQPTSEIDVNGKIMYRVGRRHMIVCLEDEIDDKDIDDICALKPRVVVFKEDGFKDDNAKINAEYNLKKAGIEDVKCI